MTPLNLDPASVKDLARITFTSGDNGATQEYEPQKNIERRPLCGVALDENGVCPKCGYRK